MLLNRQTEKNKKRHEAARKTAKRVCTQEKRENLMKKLRIIEESYKNKEIWNFHQDARKTRQTQQKTTTYLRKKNGELIGKVEEKLKRRVEYFDEVLNTDSYEEQVEDLEPQENNDQEVVQDPTQKDRRRIR
ncbi:hypothetical protein MTP99_005044 [Tenebrio molitor]|jgi:hypothetical protein|nr:hypothetical protein MTP99_005044 [Tenebrio molitor]